MTIANILPPSCQLGFTWKTTWFLISLGVAGGLVLALIIPIAVS